MNYRQCKPIAPRRGLTLVELLVVLGILAILMGIAATAVKTGTRGKKQREAARQVNTFIAGAQARAMELGRPVGIEIVRHEGLASGNSSLRVYMIETPPIYAGDTTSATATITSINTGNREFEVTFTDASMLAVTEFIRNGDQVRFNYRGEQYQIQSQPGTSSLKCSWRVDQRGPIFGTGPFPYQIYPQPQRSSVTPLQLPTDMTIDLAFSGTADTNIFHNSYASLPNFTGGSIRFTFSPKGNIDRLYFNNRDSSNPNQFLAQRPTGSIHLLIGKYEYALNADSLNTLLGSGDFESLADPTIGDDNFTNLADGTAMWVSINHLTGQVTTTRNKLISDSFLSEPTITALTGAQRNRKILEEAREFARSVITVRGQEDS